MAYAVELLFPAQQEPPRHRRSQDEVHNHLIRPELPPVASLAKAASPQLYSAGVEVEEELTRAPSSPRRILIGLIILIATE